MNRKKVICGGHKKCGNKRCLHKKLHLSNNFEVCSGTCSNSYSTPCIPPQVDSKSYNKLKKILKIAESVVTDLKKELGE